MTHRRDRLATLLWPRAQIDEARHSLATALSQLRAHLGAEIFNAGRDTVRIVPGQIECDAHRITDCEDVFHNDRPLGTFLQDFDIDDATGFQHWKDGQRARLLPLLHGVFVKKIDRCRARGDTARMDILAHHLLRVDELSEEATRALVEARAMSGDRVGALKLFEKWQARLSDELGAAPSFALARVAERLRKGNWDRPTIRVAPLLTEPWQEHQFIGRGLEFSRCYEMWARARAGSPTHAFIVGATGIGKTTLIDRFLTSVSLEGASVTRVKCYELEKELPFSVIVGLADQLIDLPGASAASPCHLAELGRLVGRVRIKYPGLPDPPTTNIESARLLFTEAVLALVSALADEQPVVLAIDDIHLADAASLAVLHLLLRRLDRCPVMVLLTASHEGGHAQGILRLCVTSSDSNRSTN